MGWGPIHRALAPSSSKRPNAIDIFQNGKISRNIWPTTWSRRLTHTIYGANVDNCTGSRVNSQNDKAIWGDGV